MRPSQIPSLPIALPSVLATGGSLILISQLVRGLVRLVGTLVLARLLLPGDFGLFGMALVVYGGFAVCRDAGLGTSALLARELQDEDRTQLTWMMLAFGAAASALMAGVSLLVSRFYAEPAVLPLLLGMSGCHLIASAAAASRVQLTRDHRFRQLTVIEVASFLVGTIVALAAAVARLGPWALVLMLVVQEVVQAVWTLKVVRWRPGRWRGLGQTGCAALRLGVGIAAYNILTYFGQSLDQALVGRWFGAHTLGGDGRACFIAMLPAQFVLGPLTGWMVQSLRAQRHSPADFRNWFGLVASATSCLSVTLAAMMATAPEVVVSFLLGAQWTETAAVIPRFALLTLAQSILIAEVWVLLACERSDLLARVALGRLVAIAIACQVGKSGGPSGVALAFAGWQIGSGLITVWLLVTFSPLRLPDLVRPLLLPWGWGAIVAATCLWVKPVSPAVLGVVVVGLAVLTVAALPPARRAAAAWLQLLPLARRFG